MIEARAESTHPVIEIFGPTIQGEGPLVGAPCYFVRFGGCDYRCSWCDSKYAVDPREVKAHAELLSGTAIADQLDDLPGEPKWVILSGGNPALQHLGPLVSELHDRGYSVQVETQGTMYRPWLMRAEMVIVSPKPPSSGMVTNFSGLGEFLWGLRTAQTALKVVVFDRADFEFARDVHTRFPHLPFYLSVGNDVGENTTGDLLAKYEWLCEQTLDNPTMRDARVLPQLHVLVWGNARGV